MKARVLIISLILCVFGSVVAAAQCQAPALGNHSGTNIFTEEQEVRLGEVFYDSMAMDLRVIDDDVLTETLQKMGDRVARKFPANNLKFRFAIVDSPEANAFALPGGRVYVTRKLIIFTRSEDELAGVLAHEMGHQITHQGAYDWSMRFKDVLGITKVSSDTDIENAYHRFLESWRIHPDLLRRGNDMEKEQIAADQVAVYATATAGYNPKAVVDFWDRFTELKGKKGSWLSDFFGTSRPESKRLREFANNAAALPEACVEKSQPATAVDFTAWQAKVRTYAYHGYKPSLPKLISEKKLAQPIRGEITNVRFSPDGNYILAQDDTSVYVLTRKPFQNVFRIDAEQAMPAQFSPDSKQVVFSTRGLRVERWDIAAQQLIDVNDVHVFHSCYQSLLSPDGKSIACLRPNADSFFPMDLSLIDVATSEPLFSKNEFIGPADGYSMRWLLAYIKVRESKGDLINMQFSPDGKYFAAGKASKSVVIDVAGKQEVKVPGNLRKYLETGFAFLGNDRIFGMGGDKGDRCAILKFPGGQEIKSNLNPGWRYLSQAGHGDFVIIRPLLRAPVGIFDIAQNKITIGSKTDAIDIYDGTSVGERVSGELAMYNEPGGKPIATAVLPQGPLGRVRSASISPDGNLLALSASKRGAVWNLTTGEQMFLVRSFHGIDFQDNKLNVMFPPADEYRSPGLATQSDKEKERAELQKPGDSVARMDLVSRQIAPMEEFLRHTRVMQSGRWLILMDQPKDDEADWSKDVTIKVKDLHTGRVAWERKFDKNVPNFFYDPRSDIILFTWDLDSGGAKDAIRDDAAAKQVVSNMKYTDHAYLIEVIDIATGKVKCHFPVDSGRGSFHLADALAFGDKVYFTDTHDRVLVYNMKGDLLGRYFGRLHSVTRDHKKIMLEQQRGGLSIIDAATRQKTRQFTFPSRVAYAEFSNDGKRVYVLTREQKLYTMDISD